jgi:transposase
MLKMTEIQKIRELYFKQGKSITAIKRLTGRDRKTIRMYINKQDWNSPEKEKQEKSFPKLNPYKTEIDKWLYEDKNAKKKQRHTAKRVYDRLCEKYGDQFDCSYRTVAGYFSMRRKEIYGNQAGFLPLEHIAGEAQADFGDADFYENGKLYNGKYLNLSFPYSNKGYFQVFKGENQECLFEGLRSIFEHIGGVPTRIWFDNPSTIVTKILKNGDRSLTDNYIRFKEHYRFEGVFCNANSGHEKGNVEGKVGYHRRNMLVPLPRFNNLSEFNRELLSKCDKDALRNHYRKNATHEELFLEDKAELLELPKIQLDVSTYITVKTNGYGRFYLNNGLHEYSTSPKYALSRVLVKITANEVMPLDDSLREIVKHERFYGKMKQQSMKWLPYLTQLSRYPGALKYTGIYRILPDSMQNYLEKCNKPDKGKILKMIAHLTEKKGFECAVETVDKALQYEVTDSDSLLSLHKRLHDNAVELPPIKMASNMPEVSCVNSDLGQYDQKLDKAGVQI